MDALRYTYYPKLTDNLIFYLKNSSDKASPILYDEVKNSIGEMIGKGVCPEIVFTYILTACQMLRTISEYDVASNSARISLVLKLLYPDEEKHKKILNQLIVFCCISGRKLHETTDVHTVIKNIQDKLKLPDQL